MDTMEATKIVGWTCAAFLTFLMVNWIGETLYHVESGGGHGHGDDHGDAPKVAYLIEVEETGGDEPEDAGPSIDEVLASADASKGAKVFSKCKACHKLEDGQNGVGPHLFGLVDRDIAAVNGFNYSGALTELDGNWDNAALDGFLANPKKYAPGTKMSFAGLKKIEDRANLIAYLNDYK